MATYQSSSILRLIKTTLLQIFAIGLVVALLLTFVIGFVEHYQQKRLHLQQLAELLSSSASVSDGGPLVAQQVRLLLEDDPAIHSIVFYATEQPVSNLDQSQIEQSRHDWYNALFASSVSFNRAVTSQELHPNVIGIKDGFAERSALIGYINITLDIHILRMQWLKANIWLWLLISGIGLLLVLFVARKLRYPSKDIRALAQVCKDIQEDKDQQLEQLPAIQQRFDFPELIQIQQALVILFQRLKSAQDHIASLAAFEANLYNKDLSLDVQRSNFQSMITHELKTSLNAISGGLQLFNPQSLSVEQQDILDIIRNGSQHLNDTLEQIIQLNKIEKGQIGINLSQFNPLQLLADILDDFDAKARAKNLTLASRVYHIDYTLEGDVGKISQVLSSLIDNAIKFSHSGNIVVESQLAHFNESIRWQIKIIDSGIGIEQKYLEDIFIPFFQVDPSLTREYEGAGIGLPVIKQIIQLIGGSIEVESEIAKGSTFTVLIPLKNSQSYSREKVLSGKTILYYHHNDAKVMVDELKSLGARVDCHQHTTGLLTQLTQDAVDIVMIGEDIFFEKAAKLAEDIRSAESHHRVILIYWFPAHEAFAMQTLAGQLQALGIDFYHQAVHDPKKLAALAERWLG